MNRLILISLLLAFQPLFAGTAGGNIWEEVLVYLIVISGLMVPVVAIYSWRRLQEIWLMAQADRFYWFCRIWSNQWHSK